MVDSGATKHAVDEQLFFRSIDLVSQMVFKLAGGSAASAEAKSTTMVRLQNTLLLLESVYRAPLLKSKVFPCSGIDQSELTIQVECDKCTLFQKRQKNQVHGTAYLHSAERLYFGQIWRPRGEQFEKVTYGKRQGIFIQPRKSVSYLCRIMAQIYGPY